MNAIVSFRLCKLSDNDLLESVDSLTDEMYKTGKIPDRQIPARPDKDYDLLVGELVKRFYERCWLSTKEYPLVTIDKNGYWECTEHGNKEFIAALRYEDKREPGKELWWIKHCVIEDRIGLCVVGDDENYPAGWEIESIEYFMPMMPPPNIRSPQAHQ